MEPPLVTLAPLPEDDFPDFLETAVSGYAADNVAAGRWLERDAIALAREETQHLLAQGRATPGHALLNIIADDIARTVGHLWFATMHRGATRIAYIYQVMIKPEFRRRGYATQALRAAEALALASGHTMMALNVFARNAGALALYRSLGYHATNTNMAKRLPAGDTVSMRHASEPAETPLSGRLPGTWELVSRIDVTDSGTRQADPSLGDDPIAMLFYDRSGHFSAQFMKRDRTGPIPDGPAGAPNNSRAQGGYDAYFGTYTVDDALGTVTQRLTGALSSENVGAAVTRAMTIRGDTLTIELKTTSARGDAVTRTLTWRRVG
jgi:ribosomal protein S18 acetylase RimI-like enzyme